MKNRLFLLLKYITSKWTSILSSVNLKKLYFVTAGFLALLKRQIIILLVAWDCTENESNLSN
jgi:hypothetical protein